MRSAHTSLGLLTMACLTLTPVYAYSHGHPASAPPHAQAPKPTKPATTTKPTSTTGPSTATMSPIAQKISSHPQLASKVKSLLPPGTTLSHASAGFKNQGQFIAALHVSKNLGIPFSKLKTDMTGDKHLSLGQSIQDLKPSARATTEAHHAEIEADDDVKTHTVSPTGKTIKKPASHTSTSTTLNPIARKISSHPQLAAKVQALLPAGLTLNQASKGFKNQGQFLAALHASKDLNIPFAQLKAEMTGKDHDSLGMAIQELKPGANARTAARTAEHEADADVKATIAQPTSQPGDKEDGQ
jgi:flagellum-specific peptidoglycan hydrolase FlgJ